MNKNRKKSHFPLQHLIREKTGEVFVICNSAITAMGIPALIRKFHPGYTGKIVCRETFDNLQSDIETCSDEKK